MTTPPQIQQLLQSTDPKTEVGLVTMQRHKRNVEDELPLKN